MIKKIAISLCLFLGLVSFAQEGSSSPYSFYGIGEVRFKGTAEARSMGGIAVEQDSIHINLENPASFSNLKLTSFSIGGTYNTTTLKTDSKSEKARRTTVDYLAIGLPLGKFGVGFGLIPYSSVGYKIKTDSNDVSGIDKTYTGSGGMNKVFVGFGYQISKKLSVGADLNYNFGDISTNYLETVSDIQSGTSETNNAKLSGVNFSIGAMFQTKIYKKTSVFGSLNYTLENDLNSKNSRFITTNTSISNTTELPVKTIHFPSKFNLSFGIGESKKWLIGSKVVFQGASNISNDYNVSSNATYGKYSSYSIGGYFIPDYLSFTNYSKRMVYRAGLKYEKTGLIVNSESIDNMGLTLGIGLPLSGTFSSVNFGFEIGKKGTTSSSLVQENYANISVGFSFNDKWFEKRKFY